MRPTAPLSPCRPVPRLQRPPRSSSHPPPAARPVASRQTSLSQLSKLLDGGGEAAGRDPAAHHATHGVAGGVVERGRQSLSLSLLSALSVVCTVSVQAELGRPGVRYGAGLWLAVAAVVALLLAALVTFIVALRFVPSPVPTATTMALAVLPERGAAPVGMRGSRPQYGALPTRGVYEDGMMPPPRRLISSLPRPSSSLGGVARPPAPLVARAGFGPPLGWGVGSDAPLAIEARQRQPPRYGSLRGGSSAPEDDVHAGPSMHEVHAGPSMLPTGRRQVMYGASINHQPQ